MGGLRINHGIPFYCTPQWIVGTEVWGRESLTHALSTMGQTLPGAPDAGFPFSMKESRMFQSFVF